jgi:hypothetical protein
MRIGFRDPGRTPAGALGSAWLHRGASNGLLLGPGWNRGQAPLGPLNDLRRRCTVWHYPLPPPPSRGRQDWRPCPSVQTGARTPGIESLLHFCRREPASSCRAGCLYSGPGPKARPAAAGLRTLAGHAVAAEPAQLPVGKGDSKVPARYIERRSWPGCGAGQGHSPGRLCDRPAAPRYRFLEQLGGITNRRWLKGRPARPPAGR